MRVRGKVVVLSVAVALVLGAGCSGDDDGGDEAADTTEETTSTTAGTTSTTQDPANWCSAFQNFASFVSAALNTGNPTASAAAFDEQSDALLANVPNQELEDLFTEVIEVSGPAFEGTAPTPDQLDRQGEALAGIREACGFA